MRQLDPDRRPGPGRTKLAGVVESESYREAQAERGAAHDLDRMIHGTPGANAAQKRAGRSFPEDVSAPMRPRTYRPLPEPDALRTPLSGRQQDERTRTRTAAQSAYTDAQVRTVTTMLGDEDATTWNRVNDELSAARGDRTAVSERTRRVAGQLDWAIQKYERLNERNHVVYTSVALPGYVNDGNIDGHIRRQFPVGDIIDFDRYTVSAHSMHEVAGDQPEREVVLEISTRRGAYLGQSRSVDNTAHLLPRGLRMEILGCHRARFRRKDGTQGERLVLQVTDYTASPETTPKESS